MTTAPVETAGLCKVYGGRTVVHDVTLTVPEGSIMGIVGTNGAGKSTCLNMMTGLIRPSVGQIRVLGVDPAEPGGDVRQQVGYVTDQDYFFHSFTVGEMVDYGRRTYRHWDDGRARVLLDSFALPADRPVRSLSKGMRVQLAFVSVLAMRPKLLILDEPTSGLDAVVRRQILQLIVQEAAGGATVVIASHHLGELERIADRVAFFHEGRVVLQASTEDARQEVRRIQAVFPNGLPEALRSAPEVMRVEETGGVYNLIVHQDAGRVLALCREHQPIFVEEMDVDFEELFIHIMHREGYAGEPIILA